MFFILPSIVFISLVYFLKRLYRVVSHIRNILLIPANSSFTDPVTLTVQPWVGSGLTQPPTSSPKVPLLALSSLACKSIYTICSLTYLQQYLPLVSAAHPLTRCSI